MEQQDVQALHEVEQLILSLYQTNTPETIARTQATLARIQNLPQAWALSKELLGRPDEKVQFFGVLTIIVKLNKESLLREEEAIELLLCLIRWYIDSVNGAGSRLVTRKLVSALSTFFLKYYEFWPRFIDHIALCLATNQACHPENLATETGMQEIIVRLVPHQIQALLWVSAHSVDDVARLDPNSATNAGPYKAIMESTKSSMALMMTSLQTNNAQTLVIEDGIKCLQSWVSISQKMPSRGQDGMSMLQPLLGRVIEFLSIDAVYDTSAELLTDVLSNNPSLFTSEHFRLFELLFKSEWAMSFHGKLAAGDFSFESVQFAQLLLAFAETRMSLLVQTCHTESSEILSCICDLLLATGYPVVDDTIFVSVVEFWSSFAETVPDHLPTDQSEDPAWKTSSIEILLKACSNAWKKIVYPPSADVADWDSNDRAGFADARKDVIDLLQSVYALVGPQLLGSFIHTIAGSLQEMEWLRLEAAVYCLGGLADCCQDDQRCDELLMSVFRSQLFSTLRDGRAEVPVRTQQTCLQLTELYTEYFERHPDLLPPALELLFSTLEHKGMASNASKSILRLCSSCRGHLHTEINAFLDEYGRVSTQQQLDCVTSERTLGALAAVAQAIVDPVTRHSNYGRILQFVEHDLRKCQRLISPDGASVAELAQLVCIDAVPDEDAALHMALRVLRCLVGIGKGVQAPSENTIDLEHESQPGLTDGAMLPDLQRRIVSIIVELQKLFPTSSDITEQICHVLRTGFSETEPGPFVLPAAEVAQYLTSHTYHTPRIGLFISTACSFISSVRDAHHQRTVYPTILVWVIGMLQQFPTAQARAFDTDTPRLCIDISAEPEVAQNALEITSRMVMKEPTLLLQLQPPELAEFFFLFTLQALDGSEPLPKSAAAEFWATFVNLRSNEEGFQGSLAVAMATLGPMLCKSLARNMGGNASRSELDKLSEPLKKLVNRHAKAKEWLEAGLHDPSFPSAKVSDTEKAIFVKKVASLRGARATNQVVRDFWLAARGSSFSYAA